MSETQPPAPARSENATEDAHSADVRKHKRSDDEVPEQAGADTDGPDAKRKPLGDGASLSASTSSSSISLADGDDEAAEEKPAAGAMAMHSPPIVVPIAMRADRIRSS